MKYLVGLNVFLHYPTKLPNAVFCEPQVFLDKINKLVEHHHFLRGSDESTDASESDESTEGSESDDASESDESTEAAGGLTGDGWIRFRKYGLFCQKFLDNVFSSQNHGDFQEEPLQDEAFFRHYDEVLFTPADFLKLLEFLLIAGKVNTTEISPEYIMPCFLPVLESDDLDNHRCHPVMSHAAPLLVHFPGEWPASGVFCSFLASLLSTEDWKVHDE